MIKHSRSQGFTHAFLVIGLVVALLGALGFIFWQNFIRKEPVATFSTDATHKSTTKKSATDTYEGWRTYSKSDGSLTFKYPNNWYTREEDSRVYISNYEVAVTKDNTPDDYQLLWISTDPTEASIDGENSVKNSTSEFRQISGPITVSAIKNGNLSINTYEYLSGVGKTLHAYWVDSTDKRYIGTTATELTEDLQSKMVENLKKILASVTVK